MPKNNIPKLLEFNKWDQALTEIQGLTVDERAELCNTFVDDRTVLTWVIIKNQSKIALALLDDLSADQRVDICNLIIRGYLHDGHSALTLAYGNDNVEIFNSLMHDFTDYHRLKIRCFNVTGQENLPADNVWRGYTLYTIAIICKNRDETTSMLRGLTSDERAALCNVVIPCENNSGHTNLTAALARRDDDVAITMLQGQSNAHYKIYCTEVINRNDYDDENCGHTPLTLAIKKNRNSAAVMMLQNLDADVRAIICTTVITEGYDENATALILAISHGLNDVVSALLKDLTDDQIDPIFTAKFDGQISMLDYFALNNLFENDVLKSYAIRKGLELRKITLRAFETKIRSGRGIIFRGIDLALKFPPCKQITLDDRIYYLVNFEDRRMPFMGHLSHLYDSHDFTHLDAWLQGFTQDDKRLALTLKEMNPNAENAVIREAFECGNHDLVNWLIAQGIPLPDRYRERANQQGIQYGQSIHNPAVHNTVGVSLKALSKSQSLSEDEINSAIQELINHANSLSDSIDNTNIEGVAKRALLRITTINYLSQKELRSGLSVAHILAYFYYHLIKIKDNFKKNDALSVFYTQLFTIQRDYNTDATGVDGTICVGGMLNQLTIALQEVCPELVWVVFASNKSEALKGLNLLKEILINAYKTSCDKITFAKLCDNLPVDKIVPDELWPFIEFELQQKMKESLYNRKMTPHRCALGTDDEVNNMVTAAIKIVKAGDNRNNNLNFTTEMQRPAELIKELLEDIAFSAGDDKKLYEARYKRLPRSIEATQKLCLKLTLDPCKSLAENDQQKANPKKTFRSLAELYLRSYTTALEPLHIDLEIDYIKSWKKYTSAELSEKKFPDSFKMIAADSQLLEKILIAQQDAINRNVTQIHLDLILSESVPAQKWLAEEQDIQKTMQILGIVPLKKEQNINDYINENSINISKALLNLAQEMIKKSIMFKSKMN